MQLPFWNLWIVVVSLLLLLVKPACIAAPGNNPRTDFWVTDGNVNAVLITNGTVYLGGDFRFVGPAGGGAATLDVVTGLPDGEYPRVNGSVFAVASDGRGGRYIGGLFNSVGNVSATNLAHIRGDKTVDTQWRPSPAGPVTALAASETTVYMGGSFTNVSGSPRNFMAAVDAVSGALTPWNPGADTVARSLLYVEEAGVVIAAGDFTQVGGQRRTGIAALDARNGAATAWAPQANGPVISMAQLGVTLYVAGNFTQIGLASRSGLAALDIFTGLATAWAPQANNVVNALAVTCDTIYAGGKFTAIGGEQRNYLAAVDPVTGQALPFWDAEIPLGDSFTSDVTALAARGETIYVGGHFDTVGGKSRIGIAALEAHLGFTTDWVPAAAGSVAALHVNSEQVYVAGYSISAGGGAPRNYLAALDLTNGKVTDWNPSPDNTVWALAASRDTVYAGGNFAQVRGLPRNGITAISAKTGDVLPWNPNARYDFGFESHSGGIFAIALGDALVYVGGRFTSIGGQDRSGLAALDLNAAATDWDPRVQISNGLQLAPGSIFALALDHEILYAGGSFTAIDGNGRSGLAAVDSQGIVTDWNPPTLTLDANTFNVRPGQAFALAVGEDVVYAGGDFNFVGSDTNTWFRNGLVAISKTTGQNTSWNPSPDYNFIRAIKILDASTIYVAGGFSLIGGQPRSNVAALDRTSGAASSWAPQPTSPVHAIALDGNVLVLGGSFTGIGGGHRPGLAAFLSEGAPFITAQPVRQTLPIGQSISLNVTAGGQAPLVYQWRRNGTNIVGATNSFLSFQNATTNLTGFFDVIVTNSAGMVFSAEVAIVVFVAPTITSQPAGQTANAGTPVTLSVAATGSPSPAFQWRRNGVNIPGATQPAYTIPNAGAQDGGSYDVVVSNPGGSQVSATAEVIVQVASLPFSDSFSSGGLLSGASGVGNGQNRTATKEPGEPAHTDSVGGRSVWLTWRPTADGVAKFSTLGSGFDTLLAVYSGASLTTLTVAGADDDRAGYLNSEVVFSALAGGDYHVAVDGFGGTGGNIVLSWNLQTNQSTIPIIQAEPQSVTVTNGGTASFSAVATGPGPLFYQWYFNCVPVPFATNATLVVSQARLRNVGSYFLRVANSFGSVDSDPAFLDIGPDVRLRAEDKFLNITKQGQAARTARTLSRTIQASLSRGFTGSQVFNTFGATTEPGEPLHCGIPGGASVWFPVLVEANGLLRITTDGSDFDTVLAVYTGPGTDFASLESVACDDDGGSDGRDSAVVFIATAGTTYYVAVDGVGGGTGTVVLNVSTGSQPAFVDVPQSRTAALGQGLELTFLLSGPGSFQYQWFHDGRAISGATNPVLSLLGFQVTNGGAYSVLVSSVFGSVTSPVADVLPSSPLRLDRLHFAHDRGGAIRLIGEANAIYVTEASTNLITWQAISTNSSITGIIELSDSQATNISQRFYRSHPR